MDKNLNIGVLIIATNKYIRFAGPLITSAQKHFLTNHNVNYYIFTDNQDVLNNKNLPKNIIPIYREHLLWPLITLYRYKTFVEHKEILQNNDYLYYCDADMLFVDTVGDEVLGDLVATIHPGFMGGRGTPETRQQSLACVHPHEQMTYFAGGFNGGKSQHFLNMSEQINKNVDIDMNNNVVAIWHDESHMNRYLINNPPTTILNSSYCYPESWNLPLPKKLLALDKNHHEMRT